MNIMTREHEKWEEFCNKLGKEIFRNAQDVNWGCKGGTDKKHAKKLLQNYDVDIEASLKYFEDHGGHCDCEILLNVDTR